MCTGWVKSLIAGRQLPPGHKGEAGTHFRKLKYSGAFSTSWDRIWVGCWQGGGSVGGPICISHAQAGTRCQQGLEWGDTGTLHAAREQSAAERANKIDFTVLSLLRDEDPAAPVCPRELIATVHAPSLSLSLLLL